MVEQLGDLLKVLTIVDQQRIVDAQHPFRFDLCPGQAGQHTQSRTVQFFQGKWTFREQTIQRTLVPTLYYEQAVDPIHRLILGYDQPTNITLKLNERLR